MILQRSFSLSLTLHHHLLDFRDGLGGVQPLRAGLRAIHDGVAAIELEGVVELLQPLLAVLG